MKFAGWVLIVLGVAQMIYAGSGFSVVAPGSVGEFGPMANIDLIGQREMIFMGGGFAFVAGWVALGASYLREAFDQRSKPSSTTDDPGAGQY